jgi:aspartate-semialdehyde dehydrogenase
LRALSEAIWVETAEPLTPKQVREALSHAEGVQVMDDPTKSSGTLPYPMPVYLSGTDDVYVGRIRRDLANENGITFWCVGDQIRKGAALNAVQIAEKIIKK